MPSRKSLKMRHQFGRQSPQERQAHPQSCQGRERLLRGRGNSKMAEEGEQESQRHWRDPATGRRGEGRGVGRGQ